MTKATRAKAQNLKRPPQADRARAYPAEVFWSDEDDGFIAVAPDLSGCSAFGETEAEAMAELRIAIEGWIEGADAIGNPVPAPSDRSQPVVYSGKFVVRVPRQLHADLAVQARNEGVSLNQYVVFLLSSGCATSRSSATLHSQFSQNGSFQVWNNRTINIGITNYSTFNFLEMPEWSKSIEVADSSKDLKPQSVFTIPNFAFAFTKQA